MLRDNESFMLRGTDANLLFQKSDNPSILTFSSRQNNPFNRKKFYQTPAGGGS